MILLTDWNWPEATPGHGSAELTVWVALPVDRPGQRIRLGSFEPPVKEIVDGPDGENRFAVWEIEVGGRDRELMLRYDFEVEAEPLIAPAEPSADVAPLDEGLRRRWTRSEYGIETGGEVAALAREIVGDESDPWLQARLVYDWMLENMTFVMGGAGENSARTVSLTRRGDCGQYALLFSALMRSLDVPARPVTGEWLDGGRHRWAEFHLPGRGWLPADPSIGQFLRSGVDGYDASEAQALARTLDIPGGDPGWLLGNLYAHRLILHVGNYAVPGPGGSLPSAEDRVGIEQAAPLAARVSGFNHDVVHGGYFVFGDKHADPEFARTMAYQRLGAQYFDAGLYDEVETGCLLSPDSEDVRVWMNLGRVYLRKGAYNKAESSFNRALSSLPGHQLDRRETVVWVRNYLGNTYDLLGRRDMALEQYRRVIEIGLDHRGAVDYARRYLETPFERQDY